MDHDKNKITIGLTGGIGSGKSTVLKMFSKCGAKTADADRVVHEALSAQGAAFQRVVRLFGKSVLKKDGTLDRARMAQRIFGNKSLRESLEAILHPIVRRAFKKQIAELKKGVLVLDIPLLFEAGFAQMVDQVVVVNASKNTRLKRLLSQGRFSRKDVLLRMNAQIPLIDKCRCAHFVIQNNRTFSHAEKQVKRYFNKLIA